MKVSVVIPTYNRAYVVGRCIASLRAQTVSDIEIIVVDDGSTDNTREVVAAIADDRIRLLSGPNRGLSNARNRGIAAAKGEYVGFIDDDDQWPPDYLQSMLKPLDGHAEYGLAYSATTLVHPDGRRDVSYNKPAGRSGWLAADLFRRSFIWPSAIVIRASVLEGFFFDENLKAGSEDSDFFLRLSVRTQYAYVSEVEAIRAVSGDSLGAKHGVTFARYLVLERFYYRQGGDKVVPAAVARKKLSHSCKRLADDFAARGYRAAALSMYSEAWRFWPWDHRVYVGLARAMMLSSAGDPQPNWRRPAPLGEPVHRAELVK